MNDEITLQELAYSILFETYYIEEVDYPLEFDKTIFNSLNHKKRIEYAKSFMKKIGAGSSRIVFDLDASTVLKVAKTAAGIAQNETEVDVYRAFKPSCVAVVYDYDNENYTWIEMEKAKKAKPSDFAKILKINFINFTEIMMYWYDKTIGSSRYSNKPVNYDNFTSTDFFYDLEQLIGNYDMPIGDIIRISSWGVANRNGLDTLVLIDFGVTNDILRQYY